MPSGSWYTITEDSLGATVIMVRVIVELIITHKQPVIMCFKLLDWHLCIDKQLVLKSMVTARYFVYLIISAKEVIFSWNLKSQI